MAIFALLGVLPFSYLPHMLEENTAITATQGKHLLVIANCGRFSLNIFVILFYVYK